MVPVNDPPVAIDKTIVIREDESYVGVLEGYDPEGENITFRMGCAGTKGLAEVGGDPDLRLATFNYTAMALENGADTFIFVVSDGELEAYGMVRIPFLPVPWPKLHRCRWETP